MKRIGELSPFLEKHPYIYRIELLQRFERMLEEKELIFVRPGLWEDPLENVILNAKIILDGKEYLHPARHCMYASCWSYEGDSYAIWKIYTTKTDDSGTFHRHPGVRITTHLNRLRLLSLLNPGADFYYGVVKYLWKKDLDKLPKDKVILRALRNPEVGMDHVRTLLMKRRSYTYEKEVRLFALPSKKMIDKKNDHICRVKIDPIKFISSVRFDPGMDRKEFLERKDELVRKYGFRPKQIDQSSYFAKKTLVIKLDNVNHPKWKIEKRS